MYSRSAFCPSLLFRQCQSVSALQYRMDEKLTRHLKGNTDKCCHQSIPWFDPIALLSGSTNICQRSCRERELLCILDVYPFSFQILESLRRCELYQTEKTSQSPIQIRIRFFSRAATKELTRPKKRMQHGATTTVFSSLF